MASLRPLTERWRARAAKWAPVVPDAVDLTKAVHWAGTNDDDLPQLSLIAAQSEASCWRALRGAWETVAQHVDVPALTGAVQRRSEIDIDRLLLPTLAKHLMLDVLEPRMATVYRHGVDATAGHFRQRRIPIKQLEADLQVPYREAARWAREHAGALVTHISARQREAIARLIARSNLQGIAPDEVARLLLRVIGLRPDQSEAVANFRQRLRDQEIEATTVRARTERYAAAQQRQRARLIARTELISSVNAGQLSLWQEGLRVGALPRGVRKRWIVTEDELLCDQCEALGAHDPIPVSATWPGGLMAPTAHPNCRCAMELVYE